MKKLVSLVVLAALVFAACGGASNTVAASVNGTDITLGEVRDLIEIEGSTIPKDQFAQFLGFEIQWEIVEQAAAQEWGIEITEGEIDAESDRIYDSTNVDETREEFTANRGVTEEFLRNIAHQGLLDIAVRAELESDVPQPSQEDVDAEIATAEASLTTVCVSHILVATEAEAQDVVGRLAAGEDFGEIAIEVSQDPGSGANGGVLPCGSAGQYVPEFRDAAIIAPIGEVYSELVETQFGFHIMMVTDRQEPAVEELPTPQDVADGLHSQAVGDRLNLWFQTQVEAAVVTVDEQYGTWATQPQAGVTPPAG